MLNVRDDATRKRNLSRQNSETETIRRSGSSIDLESEKYSSVKIQDPRNSITSYGIENVDLMQGNPALDAIDCDSQKLLNILTQVEQYWRRLPMKNSTDNFTQSIMRRFKIPTQDISRIDLGQLESNYNAHMNLVSRIGTSLARRNLLSSDPVHKSVHDRLIRLLNIIHYQKESLASTVMYFRYSDENFSLAGLTMDPFLYPTQTMSASTKLVWELRRKACLFNYRRKDKWVFQEILTPRGQPSHAWKRIKTIDQFVQEQTATGELFFLATHSFGLKDRAIADLEKSEYPNFPKLVCNRYFHSFHNGVYDVENHKFYDFDHNKPPRGSTSVKYHECYFDPEWAKEVPDHIRNNNTDEGLKMEVEFINKQFGKHVEPLNRILEVQQITDKFNDQACFKAFYLGKPLYPQCKKDKWQVFEVLLGRAGTGKSSIAMILQNYFDFEDIEILSSNSKEDFGAQGIGDKLLWMCTELKAKFKAVHPADLQSMATGEAVTLNQKFKGNRCFRKWVVPFLFFGNEPADSWTDNANNMIRRIIYSVFTYPVKNVDNELPSLLKRCIGAIMAQANMFYRCWVRRYGHLTAAQSLTPYFIQNLDQIKRKLNPIRSFLFDETRIVRSPMLYVTNDAFWDLLNDYCVRHNIPKVNKNNQQLGDVFEDAGIIEEPKMSSRNFVRSEYVKCTNSSEISCSLVNAKFLTGIGLRVIVENDHNANLCYGLTPESRAQVLIDDVDLRTKNTTQTVHKTSGTNDQEELSFSDEMASHFSDPETIKRQIEFLQSQLKIAIQQQQQKGVK